MLANYYNDIHEVTKIHAKVCHHIEGEKPTKYFTHIAKIKQLRTIINELSTPNGQPLTTIEVIIEETLVFSSKLYDQKHMPSPSL